jgi:bidirectional [NiFe] hydrogenase diaphorase subunit
MGSGGMIVMDDQTNMVEIARFFMEFCMDESCGKCIPCRAGTVQMHHLLDKINRARPPRAIWQKLEELCDLVRNTSLCGLGQTAPNPTLSTLRFFRNEYEALLQARSLRATTARLPPRNRTSIDTPPLKRHIQSSDPILLWLPKH